MLGSEACVAALRTLLKTSKRSAREIERRLGWGVGYISRLLTRRIEIKLGHLLEILEVLEVHPVSFFALAFPPARESPESLAVLRTMAASSTRQSDTPMAGDPLKALIRETVLEMVREILAPPPGAGKAAGGHELCRLAR